MRLVRVILSVIPFVSALPAALAQQPVDSAYTARIRELTTTDRVWKFNTDLVESLPASSTVPSPLKVLGYVPGTLGRLSYVADINRYFRAIAAASPRTKLFSLGMSDEGREMILLAIADESTIANLETYRTQLARLADPRGLSAVEKARLIREAKPIYWLSGSIHSPETGSPEMLMELAYRLAVDESDNSRAIRSNVITLITPVTEVDGRDRMVDWDKQGRALQLGPGFAPLIYWGKYTAHDNNRDGMVLSQKLTQNFMAGFLHWKPVVVHDLHESVPFLYTSTGTGPYNDEYDPIVVNEWHTLAYQEINELTRRGLPGIWTHGFYDGWAPNYTLLAVANLHNSIGRFYETYTSSGAGCRLVQLPTADTTRRWDRSNPPVNGIRWCIRNNINFQQSGSLIALRYVADHRETFLTNYVAKAERMIARGRNSAPHAFVIPRNQRHAAEAADMVNLFRAQGAEVHVATADMALKAAPEKTPATDTLRRATDTITRAGDSVTRPTRTPARSTPVMVRTGDWIVRLDQPYSATVRTLLAIQKFKADDPPPYDDTGWTMDALRHVETIKVTDSTIFTRPMQLITQNATVAGSTVGTGTTLIVKHLGDWRSAVLPWKLRGGRASAAAATFTVGGTTYPAGTFIIENTSSQARDLVSALGLNAVAVSSVPSVRKHLINVPRTALLHSWIETQNEGWIRFAFDQMGIPYTYISDQDLRRAGTLDRFDVVVFPHVSGAVTTLLNGRPMVGPPIPWKKTAATPNLGKWDETDDIRAGMGLEGLATLRRFVERGGLLLASGNTSRLPVEMGFNTSVTLATTPRLNARGAIFRAQPVAKASPVLYGYEGSSFPVYFNQAPLFTVAARDTIVVEGRSPAIDAQRERMRAKVILKFHEKVDSLLVSGLLANGDELNNKPAVVDAPVGKGHVILFSIRPLWRWESQGSFALALNAIANWNHLDF
ncbi:MAG TPA: M14 family zinc carboxypeptidase [Gemmatimonadaceae bacterium]|nr:M14 family zinc carboxypeptidase [Gemmatimonadaceae bacterium]